MSKKSRKLSCLFGVLAFEAYRFYKGKGIFNKIRFKNEHNAVGNYIETHHPGAFYSDIAETADGWSCMVTERHDRFVLCFSKTPNAVYVFWENKL